jgi:hypothetical protein
MNFKEISFQQLPLSLISYWRLNEDRKTQSEFRDSVEPTLTYNPMTHITNPKPLSELVEMREIYLKFCPEGFYGRFNETSGVQECYKCDSECKNCNGPDNNNCVECSNPYKLIEAEQRCVIVDGCPEGYYEDKNKEC